MAATRLLSWAAVYKYITSLGRASRILIFFFLISLGSSVLNATAVPKVSRVVGNQVCIAIAVPGAAASVAAAKGS